MKCFSKRLCGLTILALTSLPAQAGGVRAGVVCGIGDTQAKAIEDLHFNGAFRGWEEDRRQPNGLDIKQHADKWYACSAVNYRPDWQPTSTRERIKLPFVHCQNLRKFTDMDQVARGDKLGFISSPTISASEEGLKVCVLLRPDASNI